MGWGGGIKVRHPLVLVFFCSKKELEMTHWKKSREDDIVPTGLKFDWKHSGERSSSDKK